MSCRTYHTYDHPYDGRVVICKDCRKPYSFVDIRPEGIILSHSETLKDLLHSPTSFSIKERTTPMRIYTDGSCKSDKSGGWAWWNDTTGCSNSGNATNTTNQKMELEAAIQALAHHVKDHRDIVIVSDSAYLINCMQEKWYLDWISNDWHTAKAKPVQNRVLWQKLIELSTAHGAVTWEKVKGHSGDEGNDRADKLASDAASLRQTQFEKNNTTKFELYIEGFGMFDFIQWNQEIGLDWERFKTDDTYANLVSRHIAQTLEHLAKEVEEIGIVSPPDRSS